ncbi:hypothetical protein [Sphingobium subterraneum]|uniref:Uncharacterized protein n=1 Tax=Sphingobium subterraneum TaxID=627688 RepID=A0A841J057_9SPHN|nr:hypothetical protein [Sphingobium subterraneum]MBB6124227.1 hypothetical protein [Sphingobium subterraneum]
MKAELDTMPSIAWWSSRDGSDEVFNQRWIAFTGAHFLARNIFNEWRSIHPADIPSLNLAMAALFATGETQRLECRLLDACKIYYRFDAQLRSHSLYGSQEEGFLIECAPIGACRDAAQ